MMSKFLICSFLLFPILLSAQQNDFYTKGDLAIEGYDVVAYFEGKPKKGKAEWTYAYEGNVFRFANAEHLKQFKSNPQKYLPRYGGWCAYAMGKTGEKVAINPKTFEIRDGQLYLFYNAYLTNTLKKWKAEGPQELKQQADQNWSNLHQKKD